MNPNWRSFLESAEGVFDGETSEIINFGDANAELLAASKQTVVVPLTHLGLIEASGEEAKTFLHSQFTNDINHLAEDLALHAGWCGQRTDPAARCPGGDTPPSNSPPPSHR